MSSAHANHDFDCVKSHDGVIKWKCNLCCNLLSSKQRIITHLITTHGKTNLCEHGHRQTLRHDQHYGGGSVLLMAHLLMNSVLQNHIFRKDHLQTLIVVQFLMMSH